MGPSRSFLAGVIVLLGLSSSTLAAVAPTFDWKLANGWNQTVLPSLGTSVGPFTPPAGAIKTAPKLAAEAASAKAQGKPGGVFICEDIHWKGLCGYAVEPLNECILLSDPWLTAISSFGPDPGATCFAFSSGDCDQNNAQWSFTFPGDDTGGVNTTNPFNDKITSFACVKS
ncbi:hypothetical protein R3P38DRAFT_2837864 [Favolaschia claudopus]|uniref:Uncharacterized protein n=1 Tax=Favolaschia claudopus TaxID=2862362 RepID=A0AAW0E7G4_9AGAR